MIYVPSSIFKNLPSPSSVPTPGASLDQYFQESGISSSDSLIDYYSSKVSDGISNKINKIENGIDYSVGYLEGLFPPSDTSAIDNYLIDSNYLYDKLIEIAERQSIDAQASADRAMEFNAKQAEINRKWQEEQNQKAMDFSERMSNTSYQRAMEDMKAAGLNPKLVGQLSGASTPSGVSSSGFAASGSAASIAAANLAPMAQLMSTYITGSDAMDRQNRDFTQNVLLTLLKEFLS